MGYYKRKDRENTWKLEHYMGYKPSGKRKVKTKTIKAKNEKEAKKKYYKWVTEIEEGEYIEPSKTTLSNFIDEKWVPLYAEQQLSPTTFSIYKTVLDTRIKPFLGEAKLEEVKTVDIQEVITNFSNDKKPETLQKYKNALSNVMNRALEWEYIKSNPVSKVRITKEISPGKKEFFTKKELKEILDTSIKIDLKLSVILHLAFFCGLRRGEIGAVTWNDIDLEKGEMQITKSLTEDRIDDEIVVRTKITKTGDSRIFKLPSKLTSLLADLKNELDESRTMLGEEWYQDEYFVISTDFGHPYRPENITQKWTRFRDKYGFKKLGLHDFRHATATFLNSNEVGMKMISEFLGHSDTRTTSNIYTHIFGDDFQDVTKHFDDF